MVAYLSPTATTSSNTTPCCVGTCTCCTNRIVLVVVDIGDRWTEMLRPGRYDIEAALASFKEAAKLRIECWMLELCAIPRRMKRPFPPSLPAPTLHHAVIRPVRRNWRRYRRLWRHAKRDWF